MKQTINYANLPEGAKRKKAVADTMSYLGDMFPTAVRCVEECESLKQVYFTLAFCGVEGYPCRAMWETYNNAGQQEIEDARA